MSLAAQQRAFAALLDSVEPVSHAALLRTTGAAPARLDVYHHAYRARLVEALRSNYPVLHRVLGDEAFRELALGYLAEHPSRRASVRWFGHSLPDWMASHERTLPHAALVDLAKMEWTLGLSFDAADATPVTFEQLAAMPAEEWPGACFGAHPSASLLRLRWAVEPIWRALTDDEEAASEEPQAHAHTLLVWRQGLDTRWRSLEPDEAKALVACFGGEAFAALCDHATAAHGDAAPAWVAGALRRWVDDGLLVRP
jgi:hypothetical protein